MIGEEREPEEEKEKEKEEKETEGRSETMDDLLDGLESDGVYSDDCSGDWSVGHTFGVKHLVDILCGDGQMRLRWVGEMERVRCRDGGGRRTGMKR